MIPDANEPKIKCLRNSNFVKGPNWRLAGDCANWLMTTDAKVPWTLLMFPDLFRKLHYRGPQRLLLCEPPWRDEWNWSGRKSCGSSREAWPWEGSGRWRFSRSACSWSSASGRSEPRSQRQPFCRPDTVFEVLSGLRTNGKSRSKTLEEEWEKPGVQAAGAPVGGFQPVMVWSHRVSSGQSSVQILPGDVGALQASLCWAPSWRCWFHPPAGPVVALRPLVCLKFDCSVSWFHLNSHRVSVVKRRGSSEGHYWNSLGFHNPWAGPPHVKVSDRVLRKVFRSPTFVSKTDGLSPVT